MTSHPAPDHPDRRPLHAVLLDGVRDAARLLDPLARALDGTGPAILPVDGSLPAARISQLIDAFQPSTVIDHKGEAHGSFWITGSGTGDGRHHRHLGIHRRA